MSSVWLLLSSSAQWSLPPWESAVWIKPVTEGASGAAADRAHPPLQAATRLQEEEDEGMEEEKYVRRREEGRGKT